MTISQRTRPRLTIIGLFAVFLLPIVAALVLNLPGVRWTPFGMRNHGELLTPPPSLESSTMTAVDGGRIEGIGADGTWTLLLTAPAPCDAACREALDRMQRARIALGEHGGRLTLVWLIDPPGSVPDVGELDRLRGGNDALRVARLADGSPPLPWAGTEPGMLLHVVDPRAFAVLRYRPGFDGRDLLKDLERLLRYAKDSSG